jgi:hypothetical protein
VNICDQSFFSFGGGRQGTAIALMMIHNRDVLSKLNYPIPRHVIFADTGREPAKVYTHVEKIRQLLIGADYQFHLVSVGSIGDTHRSKTLLPLFTKAPGDKGVGMLSRSCTQEFKINPIRKKIKELMGITSRIWPLDRPYSSWLGISIDEAQRAKPSAFRTETTQYPLIDLQLSVSHCVAYSEKILGYPPPKSACYICPMRSPSAWQNMATDDPESFASAVAFDKEIRTGVARKPAYLHSSGQPLDLAVESNQLSLFSSGSPSSCDSGHCFN